MRALVVALALVSGPAAAQSVVFHEDFEDGLAGWSATGLWNAEAATDPCGAHVAPFPDGNGAAYYGGANGVGCNYDTGVANSGGLSLTDWIQLPAGASSITMHYWSWSHTEFCWGGWDAHLVWILVEGGATLDARQCTGGNGTVLLPWHERVIDLTGLAGLRVRPLFEFDTGDEEGNGLRGWFLDRIRIVTAESGVRVCPTAGSLCPCTQSPASPVGGCANSTGAAGDLAALGTTVVSSDTLTFTARGLPSSASSLLVQATAFGTPVHFGDGVRCVSGPVQRMGAVVASNGVASWPPSGSDPISIRGGVPAGGGTRYYYVYYRDVLAYCTSASFNSTDTQQILWLP